MRMLIVDDSKAMRGFLTSIARELSFEPETAEDGINALEILECDKELFDIALVDWDMPRMNGLELLQAVRGNDRYAPMKLMMVTSHNDMDDVVAAMGEGADDFLMKPVTQEMLQDKLRMMGLCN